MERQYQHLGRVVPSSFDTPEQFLQAAAEYFHWCEDHPLKEEQVFQYKGSVVRADRDKARPFTKSGLAVFLNIPQSRLNSYAKRGEEWEEAVELIEQAIYTQKFDNAAVNLMNATIISRDLGLADKQEVSSAITVNIPDEDAGL